MPTRRQAGRTKRKGPNNAEAPSGPFPFVPNRIVAQCGEILH